MSVLDARSANPREGGPSFPLRHRLERALWNACWLLLASWTPRPFHGWRRLLLRAFGADLARGAAIYPGARIWYPRNLRMGPYACLGQGVTCYNMALIVLEDHVVVSQGAHLCAGDHDIRDPHFQLTVRPIVFRRECWIAAEAFVGPGVTVGEGAVLGARGVAMKDLEPWAVYIGNPARQVGMRHARQAPP